LLKKVENHWRVFNLLLVTCWLTDLRMNLHFPLGRFLYIGHSPELRDLGHAGCSKQQGRTPSARRQTNCSQSEEEENRLGVRRSNFMRSKLQFFMRLKLRSWGQNSTFSWDQIFSIIFDNFDQEVDTLIMRSKPQKALFANFDLMKNGAIRRSNNY
jgi:hypothetical protein